MSCSGPVVKEGLPFPWVHYPRYRGVFLGFAQRRRSQVYLCECSRAAVRAYLEMRQIVGQQGRNADPTRNFLADSLAFPVTVTEWLMQFGDDDLEEIFGRIHFAPGLCHECNRAVPSLRYCHPMYGGTFRQKFGWYINKQACEWGIYRDRLVLPDLCPAEVRALFQIDAEGFASQYMRLRETGNDDEASALLQRWQRQRRRVAAAIENAVREKFGYPPIGEGWVSETALYRIVQQLYPDQEVLHHCRPEFLDGLELDVYVPALRLAIEYQGVQHYQPVEHWGGREALNALRARDRRKRQLCQEAGVCLVTIRYDEPLDPSYIAERIERSLKQQRGRLRRGSPGRKR